MRYRRRVGFWRLFTVTLEFARPIENDAERGRKDFSQAFFGLFRFRFSHQKTAICSDVVAAADRSRINPAEQRNGFSGNKFAARDREPHRHHFGLIQIKQFVAVL